MARPRKRPAAAAPPLEPRLRAWLPFALLFAAVLVFYWTPLTSPDASIQWDAVDVHLSAQKYFSDHVRGGRLPFWTPYLFSGSPFLADVQVGAWYPLHWPFFLIGITPRVIQLELALHALLASLGAYLLARRLLDRTPLALAAAFFYGLGGFFAGHASHVGIFEAASWLPWLLLGLERSLDAAPLRSALWTGLAAGLMLLAGHFQTALYAFAALALYGAAACVYQRARLVRAAAVVGAVAVLAALVAAVQILPAWELVARSIRAGADFSASSQGALTSGALMTLVAPNWLGALEGDYHGPADITQHYFYAGLALVPLAALGLADRRLRWRAGLPLAASLWYALGPSAGLYRLVAALPAFASVRAPVHAWFVAALCLALLAAAGLGVVANRIRWPYLAGLVLLLVYVDLLHWNSLANPLAYARRGYQDLYGAALDNFEQRVAATQPPLSRFHAPANLSAFGPLNHPLDARIEATYGYNPLALSRYTAYLDAAARNPKLLAGLNVSRQVDVRRATVEPVEGTLPRAVFPPAVVLVASAGQARQRLDTLDPSKETLVAGPLPGLRQDPSASASVVWHDERGYRIRYRAASKSLLRVASPFFPGWKASLAGVQLPVVEADYALAGIILPAGEGEVALRYEPTWFGLGAALSAAAVLAALARLAWPQPAPGGPR